MTSLKIAGLGGKKTLEGEITVGGAKNAALKVLASTLLFNDIVTLTQVPEIEDVKRVCELLEYLGATVDSSKHNQRVVNAATFSRTDLTPEIAGRMRSSIVFTGPMLARSNTVSFPNPGGCNLGNRPIDIFLEGFQAFGATVTEENDMYVVDATQGLTATDFFFRVVTHTGTETLMMLAVRAKGTTVLRNCAIDPEVKSLADFLNKCGAKISGAGTSTITIKGISNLLSAKEQVYVTIPDRIEAVSYMILGALAAKELRVKNVCLDHIEMSRVLFKTIGIDFSEHGDEVVVKGGDTFRAVNLRTHEYPGLSTDIQPLYGLLLTQCDGESTIFETIFENRLGYLKDLARMGAEIVIEDNHRARIIGKRPLFGTELIAPDLRAGSAFVFAGIVAEGETIVKNAYNVDRGYEAIEERLQSLGADITRVE